MRKLRPGFYCRACSRAERHTAEEREAHASAGFPLRGNHGCATQLATTPEYSIWCDIKKRCFNQNFHEWHRYGGRGITMFPGWVDDFASFLGHVGRRPSPNLTLERIDNDRGYHPGNLRWSTRTEQSRNQSTNRVVTAFGESLPVAAWAEKTGIKYRTIMSRLNLGWSPERALRA